MKKLFYLLLVIALIGCEQTTDNDKDKDPNAAKEKVNQANQALESVFYQWINGHFDSPSDFDQLNFKLANNLYKEALTLDPTNLSANFGAAITEFLDAYSDPDINQLVKDWEAATRDGFGKNLLNPGFISTTDQMQVPLLAASNNAVYIFQKALTDPPLISRMQTVLGNKLLPRINYAIEKLTACDQVDTFKFAVTGKMQGDPQRSTVYIYPTEAAFINASLNGVKLLLEEFLVYKFTLNDYSQQSLINALSQNNTDFFVLAADGSTHALNAKNAMNTMVDKMLHAINKLETISGHKNDAIIKIGNDGLKQRDLDTAKTYLNKVKLSMQQAVQVTIKEVGLDEETITINVFLAKMFDNPVQNPKAHWLPPYTVTASGDNDIQIKFGAQTYNDFVFPDPTFGGIFPGMTNNNMKKLMGIDREYACQFEGGINFDNLDIGSFLPRVQIRTAQKNYNAKVTPFFHGWGYWYEYEAYILDQNDVSYTIFIDYGNGFEELASTDDMMIRQKKRNHREIRIADVGNLIANVYQNPLRIQLYWNGGGIDPVVQRSIGASSTPTDYFSLSWFNNFYEDYSISSGQTYRYRIRTSTTPQDWMMVLKNPKYSNIVTVTP